MVAPPATGPQDTPPLTWRPANDATTPSRVPDQPPAPWPEDVGQVRSGRQKANTTSPKRPSFLRIVIGQHRRPAPRAADMHLLSRSDRAFVLRPYLVNLGPSCSGNGWVGVFP